MVAEVTMSAEQMKSVILAMEGANLCAQGGLVLKEQNVLHMTTENNVPVLLLYKEMGLFTALNVRQKHFIASCNIGRT